MRWPLDNFTVTQQYSESHPALDLAAPEGAHIKAPENGVIAGINNNAAAYYGGRYVVLNGDSGYRHYMGHNFRNRVTLGQRVTEGQHIADVGMTGFAIPARGIAAPSGPHIHHEVSRNASTVAFVTLNPKGGGDMEKMIVRTRQEAKALYYLVYHRDATDQEADGLIGKWVIDIMNQWHVSQEWKTINHRILKWDDLVAEFQKRLDAAKTDPINRIASSLEEIAVNTKK